MDACRRKTPLVIQSVRGIQRDTLIWEYAMDAVDEDAQLRPEYDFKGVRVVNHTYQADPLQWPSRTSKIWFLAAGQYIPADIPEKPLRLQLSEFSDGGISLAVRVARETTERAREYIRRIGGFTARSTLTVCWAPPFQKCAD